MKRITLLRAILFAVIALLTCSTLPAHASTFWYVSPTGNNANDCLSAATACRTIQAAVNKASGGDFIQIGAGTYSAISNGETFPIVINKSLSFHGVGSSTTIIDVNSSGQNGFSISGCGYYLILGDVAVRGAARGIEVLANADNCITGEISHNQVTNNQIGVYLQHANTNVRRNDILSNSQYGIYNYASPDYLQIERNSLGWNGDGNGGTIAGIYNYYSNCYIINNGIGWNNASGIFNEHSSPTITNNTISFNFGGSGIGNFSSSSPVVTNNIVTSNALYGIHQDATSAPVLTYNDVWANYWGNYYGPGGGTGSISADPLFAALIDVHLQAGSPAINAGSNSAQGIPTVDYDGLPRIVGASVDMGAFEYQSIVVEYHTYLPVVRR